MYYFMVEMEKGRLLAPCECAAFLSGLSSEKLCSIFSKRCWNV